VTLALRQSESSRADAEQWIGIEEAASLSGITVDAWRYRARKEADAARRAHRTSLARLAQGERGRPGWEVNRCLDDRLSPSKTTWEAAQAREALCGKYPQHLVERAWKRRDVLHRWRQACLSSPNQTQRELAVKIVAEASRAGDGFAVSVRSLYRWHHAFRKSGIEGLVDRYGADPAERVTRSPEAIETFYSLYRTQSQHSVERCHVVTLHKCEKRGWPWPQSLSATRRWLAEHDDLAITCLLREGTAAYMRKFAEHVEFAEESVQPGEKFVGDHSQFDFWVDWDGDQVRPWITTIQDRRARVICGYHIGKIPHSDSILRALHMAFRDWAIPERIVLDNGKDFQSRVLVGASKQEVRELRKVHGRNWRKVLERDAHLVDIDTREFRWGGILAELQVKLTTTLPYSPWSKGTQERFYGTMHSQFDKTFATYCGRNAVTRPECLADIRRGYTRQQRRDLKKKYGRQWLAAAMLRFCDQNAVPGIDQVKSDFADWLLTFHHAAHSGAGMNGRSPIEVFHTATRLRKAQADQLAFLVSIRGEYKVGGNGVHVDGLSYGANCAAMKPLRGRRVLIAKGDDDVGYCYALDLKTRVLIARLDANERVDPGTTRDDQREVMARIGRRRKLLDKAKREAPHRTRTAAQELRQFTREKAVQLRRTGTDDVGVAPRIVPVATGFEGLSRPDRTHVENVPSPTDWEGVEDLFDDEAPTLSVAPFDSAGMEDLFDDDEPGDGQAGEGLDGL